MDKIRIEPQWNVNYRKRVFHSIRKSIRIEPQWNVNYNVYANPVLGSDQNRTIVECKSQSYHDSSMRTPDQNRTIVECKQRFIFKKGVINEIRIEPQWNVNVDKQGNLQIIGTIRIEPQWNVNVFLNMMFLDVLDQNRTIVECKYQNLKLSPQRTFIRIEPQWNVNITRNSNS